MAAVALASATLTHTTAVTVAASPGVVATLPDGNLAPNGGNSTLVMNNTHASIAYWVDIYQASNADGLAAVARRFTVPALTVQEVKLGPVSVYGASVLIKCENVAIKLSVKAV